MTAYVPGRCRAGSLQAWGLQGHGRPGGGGRRTGSLQNGWPAGHHQGRPFLLAPLLGPTTFWALKGGRYNPAWLWGNLWCERQSQTQAAAGWFVMPVATARCQRSVDRFERACRVAARPVVNLMWCLQPNIWQLAYTSWPFEAQPCHSDRQKPHPSP